MSRSTYLIKPKWHTEIKVTPLEELQKKLASHTSDDNHDTRSATVDMAATWFTFSTGKFRDTFYLAGFTLTTVPKRRANITTRTLVFCHFFLSEKLLSLYFSR